jgi:hypothetical protein
LLDFRGRIEFTPTDEESLFLARVSQIEFEYTPFNLPSDLIEVTDEFPDPPLTGINREVLVSSLNPEFSGFLDTEAGELSVKFPTQWVNTFGEIVATSLVYFKVKITPVVSDPTLVDINFESSGTFEVVSVAAVTSVTGKAHGVGLANTTAGISIVGIFTSDGAIDLSAPAATVTIESLFNEVGGAGEVADDLPLTLFADSRNNANVARFNTPVGTLPIAKVMIGAKGGGRFTLRVDVAKATIEPPSLCPTTDLHTSFTINDGVHPPVVVTTTQPWLCFGAGNKYLKSPPP